MKKTLILIALPLMLLSCRANFPVAQQTGREDIAYLLFVSPNEYAGKKVSVFIDDEQPFVVEVVQAKKASWKGIQYAVKTGTRLLKVSNGDRTLYNKKIFISSQEVKQVILP